MTLKAQYPTVAAPVMCCHRVLFAQGHGQQAQPLLFACGTTVHQRPAGLPQEAAELLEIDRPDASERYVCAVQERGRRIFEVGTVPTDVHHVKTGNYLPESEHDSLVS